MAVAFAFERCGYWRYCACLSVCASSLPARNSRRTRQQQPLILRITLVALLNGLRVGRVASSPAVSGGLVTGRLPAADLLWPPPWAQMPWAGERKVLVSLPASNLHPRSGNASSITPSWTPATLHRAVLGYKQKWTSARWEEKTALPVRASLAVVSSLFLLLQEDVYYGSSDGYRLVSPILGTAPATRPDAKANDHPAPGEATEADRHLKNGRNRPLSRRKCRHRAITAPQAQQAGSQEDIQTPVSMRCDGKIEEEGRHAEPSQATAAELEMAADSGEGGKHGENGARSASGDDEVEDDAASAAKTWSLQRAASRDCQATGRMTASRRAKARKQCASPASRASLR
ncbi:hypothetical protein MRX96_015181 [Rhipicephalus microplus]